MPFPPLLRQYIRPNHKRTKLLVLVLEAKLTQEPGEV